MMCAWLSGGYGNGEGGSRRWWVVGDGWGVVIVVEGGGEGCVEGWKVWVWTVGCVVEEGGECADGVGDVGVGAVLGKGDVCVGAVVVKVYTIAVKEGMTAVLVWRRGAEWARFHGVGGGGRFQGFVGVVGLGG